jgi:glycine oxidase
MMPITVIGAGIGGLTCALELARRGAKVEVLERGAGPGTEGCSWLAGGMLAPWCEQEAGAEPLITLLGVESLAWWREHCPSARFGGTLVVASRRDAPELARFAQRTEGHRWLDAQGLALLEPDLAGRFDTALFFEREGHLDPREALPHLVSQLRAMGVTIRFGCGAEAYPAAGLHIDCRGLAARDALRDLRGVRGEMLRIQTRELQIHRPVRLLHPRTPVYVIPRSDGLYMLGATAIESEEAGDISVRSALELLSAACAVHPAFGEARIVESGAQVRPAFADNLPHVRRCGDTLYVNGLYRHGFLIAPALASRVAEMVLSGRSYPEISDENPPQRRLA